MLCGKRHRHNKRQCSKLLECFHCKGTSFETGLCSAQDDMPSTDRFQWYSDDIADNELSNLFDNDMQSTIQIDNLTEENKKVITFTAETNMLVGEVRIMGSQVSFLVAFTDQMGRTATTNVVSNLN
jgi:hypothetical protein